MKLAQPSTITRPSRCCTFISPPNRINAYGPTSCVANKGLRTAPQKCAHHIWVSNHSPHSTAPPPPKEKRSATDSAADAPPAEEHKLQLNGAAKLPSRFHGGGGGVAVSAIAGAAGEEGSNKPCASC
eukprot:TRINITY_DN467_c0_g1_i1.p2 TRINITY_DN467_c0_g1~~TRINITY_DN467_c0_g1_i1.p2  ORF type:complete len:127 (-),score=15.85 TRINITY_DN467_c0_g1_i1:227-607(-)